MFPNVAVILQSFNTKIENLFNSLTGCADADDSLSNELLNRLLDSNGSLSIDSAEEGLKSIVTETVMDLLVALIESVDTQLWESKALRKERHLVVERRGDVRSILLSFGQLVFQRTYYQATGTDGISYSYPIDNMLGISSNQRMSHAISNDLVHSAMLQSYQKSSNAVTGGLVSKQTVMNKLREASPLEEKIPVKRAVPSLHIDVDEDHVHLQEKEGKSSGAIVPLATVYEGVAHQGKRGICINAFSVSEYGMTTDDFWNKVLSEIEKRYDLSNTTVYIHGDGAAWISAGLEWFPNAKFVLDQYHKNMYLKKAVAGMCQPDGRDFVKEIKDCLHAGDKEKFLHVQNKMKAAYPDRAESISESMEYLYNNFDGIHIRATDPEANNGGATEPHVSHVLSARLSSRPMGWSKKTLKVLVPLLASRTAVFGVKRSLQAIEEKKVSVKKKHSANPYARILGLPNPNACVSIPTQGKVNWLFKTLYPYFGR